MIKCKARTNANVLIISKPIISAQRALNGFLTPEMGSPYQSALSANPWIKWTDKKTRCAMGRKSEKLTF